MRETRRRGSAAIRAGSRSWLAAACLAFTGLAALAAGPAGANIGYELDATTPSRSLSGKLPHGMAVDQANRRIYVAIVTANAFSVTPGEVLRFESDLSAAGAFTAGGEPQYTGVAVNPVTQGFYAVQAHLRTPLGDFGIPRMDPFSAAGVAGTPFAVADTSTLPQIATDSSGDVYYPNAANGKVQVFNSSGALQEEIGCGGCPGGAFGEPVSVALNSKNDLYVVDMSPDRVVKMTSSGGPYSFASVLQSGRDAAAVGVDPGTDDVFVGNLPDGTNYHIVAYTSAGVQFDDFGAGLFTDPLPEFGALVATQIAADATSHKLYVGDDGKFYVFERTTIDPPAATIASADPVGQLTATLRATVNANGHAALACEFEYTDGADFQANGFANADIVPCSKAPDGSGNMTIANKVSGLSPVTDYHYRMTVTSNAGSTTSGTATFETLPVVPPEVTAEPPVSVTETSAMLRSSVNPRGGSVSSCRFEFGASVSYGTNLNCQPQPGPVATNVVEERKISNLQSGATYHYRLVVTTNAGTTQGDDVVFTAASPPPPPPPPPSDPPPSLPPPAVPEVITPPQPTPPLRCKRGFRKKMVRGKLRCVKKRQRKRSRAARRQPAPASRR